MPRILTDVLKVLRRLYGPGGQLQAPLDIEYGLPVQMVHDISRQAEFGTFDGEFGLGNAGISPYFTIVVDNVHADSEAIAQEIGVYSNQSPGWASSSWVPPDPKKETVWVLGVSSFVDVSTSISLAYVTMDMQPKAGAGSGAKVLFPIYAAVADFAVANTAGLFPMGQLAPQPIVFPVPLSNKLLNNTVLEFVSMSTITGTIDFNVFCIRLPNGVLPPGLG